MPTCKAFSSLFESSQRLFALLVFISRRFYTSTCCVRLLRLDHDAAHVHGVPGRVADAEPDRAFGGRRYESALVEPKAAAEAAGTVVGRGGVRLLVRS